ncbi:MAG: DUF222 domain-containing protein [Acidimicrobiia bacterium]|nr:DUF222 domain-containing protein [Acidimicrobiia bacterium]
MRSVVDQLGEAVDGAAAVELDTLSDSELDAELVALLHLRHRLDAQIARRAAAWDARTVWLGDGSCSPVARLARDGQLAYSSARRILRHARAVTSMPTTAAAWQAGDIGGDHVDLLAHAMGGGRGELFSRDENLLVDQCEQLRYKQATTAVAYWCQRADAELGHDGTPPPADNSLQLGTTFAGTVTGNFTLDPISGATVVEALRRVERELYRQDKQDGISRTLTERLAAALVEIVERGMSVPKDARRPEPLVCILAGKQTVEHLCELATSTVIHPGVVVPHLARSQVQTFIFDGADHVIAASAARTFRGTLRRAIQVRDRRCQHPSGCDTPLAHCDVDHVVSHHELGLTEEPNGQVLCEPHNRKSDLRHRQPADAISAARQRRQLEDVARDRLHALIADHANRPPPAAP